MTTCQNPGARTYLTFAEGSKFEFTARFPDYVLVTKGMYMQEKIQAIREKRG
jgi:hypothetical protein